MKLPNKITIKKGSVDSILFFILFLCTFLYDERTDKLYLLYIVFICAGILCLYRIINNKRQVYFPRCLAFLVLFYIWAFWGALANPNGLSTIMNRLITMTILYVLLLILINYLHSGINFELILISLFWAGVIFSFAVMFSEGGIQQYLFKLISGGRLGDNIGNVNSVGMNLSFSYAAGCYILVTRKGKKLLIFFIPILLACFGTGSRKVLIFIACITFLYVIHYIKEYTTKKSSKRYLTYLKYFLFIIFILLVLLSSGILDTTLDRFTGLMNIFSNKGKVESSANIRMNMIQIGLKSVSEHPFFGIGLGNTGIITMKYLGRNTYLHNNYIEILASTGIIGFLFYYSFYAVLFVKMLLRYLRYRDNIIFWGLATLFIQLILEIAMVSYYSKRLILFTSFWVFLAFDKKAIPYSDKNS